MPRLTIQNNDIVRIRNRKGDNYWAVEPERPLFPTPTPTPAPTEQVIRPVKEIDAGLFRVQNVTKNASSRTASFTLIDVASGFELKSPSRLVDSGGIFDTKPQLLVRATNTADTEAAVFTHTFDVTAGNVDVLYAQSPPVIGDAAQDADDDPTPRYPLALPFGFPFFAQNKLGADVEPTLRAVDTLAVTYASDVQNILTLPYAFNSERKSLLNVFTGVENQLRFTNISDGSIQFNLRNQNASLRGQVRVGDAVLLSIGGANSTIGVKAGVGAAANSNVTLGTLNDAEDAWIVESTGEDFAVGTLLRGPMFVALKSSAGFYLGHEDTEGRAVYANAPTQPLQFGSTDSLPIPPSSATLLTFGMAFKLHHRNQPWPTPPNDCPSGGPGVFDGNQGANDSFVSVKNRIVSSGVLIDHGALEADATLPATPFGDGAVFQLHSDAGKTTGSNVLVGDTFFLTVAANDVSPMYVVEDRPLVSNTVEYGAFTPSRTTTAATPIFRVGTGSPGDTVPLNTFGELLRNRGVGAVAVGVRLTQMSTLDCGRQGAGLTSVVGGASFADIVPSDLWRFQPTVPRAEMPTPLDREWVLEFRRDVNLNAGNVTLIKNAAGQHWQVSASEAIVLTNNPALATPFVLEEMVEEFSNQFILRQEGSLRRVSVLVNEDTGDLDSPLLRCVRGEGLALRFSGSGAVIPFDEASRIRVRNTQFSSWTFEVNASGAGESVEIVGQLPQTPAEWTFALVADADREPSPSNLDVDHGLVTFRSADPTPNASVGSGGGLTFAMDDTKIVVNRDTGKLDLLIPFDAEYHTSDVFVVDAVDDFSNRVTLTYQRGNETFTVPNVASGASTPIRMTRTGFTSRGEPMYLMNNVGGNGGGGDDIVQTAGRWAPFRNTAVEVIGTRPSVEDLFIAAFQLEAAGQTSDCSTLVSQYTNPGSIDAGTGIQRDEGVRMFVGEGCTSTEILNAASKRLQGNDSIRRELSTTYQPKSLIVPVNSRLHLIVAGGDPATAQALVLRSGVWNIVSLRDEYTQQFPGGGTYDAVSFDSMGLERIMHSDFYACSSCGGNNAGTGGFVGYVPGVSPCDDIVQAFCAQTMHRWLIDEENPGKDAGRWKNVCGCFKDLADLKNDLLVTEGTLGDLPVTCFGPNCQNTGSYRTSGMLAQQCTVQNCVNSIKATGENLLRNNTQTVDCRTQFGVQTFDVEDFVGPTPTPPPTPPTPTPTPGGDGDDGFPIWAILVIVFGVLVLIGVAVGLALRNKNKNKKKKKQQQQQQNASVSASDNK
jgi:hypothetical protein